MDLLKLADEMEKLQNKLKGYTWSLARLVSSLGLILVEYSVIAYIFLHLYSMYGFEKTLIILLIGILVFFYRAWKSGRVN